MTDTMTAKTPMSDHVARFWQTLETEHVRIIVDMLRNTSSVPYWDAASFGDDVAKALVADRRALFPPEPTEGRVERLRALLGDLYATVKGECPSLLNEDSGGDGRLDVEIQAALRAMPAADGSS